MLLCAVALLLASANDTRVVVVATPHPRAQALYDALQRQGYSPIDLPERAGIDLPVDDVPAVQARDDVRAQFHDAKTAMRSLDTARARALANAAIDTLLRLEHPEEETELWWDVLLFRAGVLLVEGQNNEAAADLLLASRLVKDRTELHPGLYAPRLVQAYNAAREQGLAAQRTTVIIQPRAVGNARVEVAVDGEPFLPGEPLSQGPHLLTLRTEQQGQLARIMRLDATPWVYAPFVAPPGTSQKRAQATATLLNDGRPADRTVAVRTLLTASAARVAVIESPLGVFVYVPLRGLVKLAARQGAAPDDIARQVTVALTTKEAEAPAETAVGYWIVAGVGLAAAVLVPSIGLGLAYWYWPASEDTEAPPPRPVAVGCCS